MDEPPVILYKLVFKQLDKPAVYFCTLCNIYRLYLLTLT